MPPNEAEVRRREKLALEAIRRSFGTEEGEHAATLFASHHLDELEPAYWQTHLQTGRPQPADVLSILRLESHWSEDDEDGIDMFDFSLPGNVTQYLLCVRFDELGRVVSIDMES